MLCELPKLDKELKRSPHVSIGQAIKHYRVKNKLTQAQLAKKLDVCQASISHYEKDRVTPPVKVLQKLSRELGVQVQLLIEHRYTFI